MPAGNDNGEREINRGISARVQLLLDAVERDGVTEEDVRITCGVKYPAWNNYRKAARSWPMGVLICLRDTYGCAIEWLVIGEAKHNDPAFQAKLYAAKRDTAPAKPRRGRPRKPRDWPSDR